ncbi:hypothetical protein A0130_09545 [Leifsonia xyli]|uniref:hypothetical protein n=1 Tax=Leifsonia xyli TaxID=1575 RepID=UPI0007CDE17A|nr:hypothetical protein A0130_09545 [Leifsonia xyli]
MSVDAFDFNKPPNEERERLGIALWAQTYPRIDDLETKLNGPYMLVQAGSTLAVDDRFLGRWRAGGLQGGAMAASLDALLTARMVLEAGTLPMTALYPVFRAAIENASLAIYLLSPDARDDRLVRAYGIAADEAQKQFAFQASLGQDGASARDQILSEIRNLVEARGTLGDAKAFRPMNSTHTLIVKSADEVIERDPAIAHHQRMPLVAIWQLLSGMSHAKQWALITALHRTEAIVNEEDQTAHVKLTSGTELVALVMNRAVEALEVALRFHGRRSKTWTALPEDTADMTRR